MCSLLFAIFLLSAFFCPKFEVILFCNCCLYGIRIFKMRVGADLAPSGRYSFVLNCMRVEIAEGGGYLLDFHYVVQCST